MKINELIDIIRTKIDNIRTTATIISISNIGSGIYEFLLNDISDFIVGDNIKIQDTPNFNIEEIEIIAISDNKIQLDYTDTNLTVSTFGKIINNNPSFVFGEAPEINEQLTNSNFKLLKKDVFIILELPITSVTSGENKEIMNEDFTLNLIFGKHENYKWTYSEIINIQSDMQEIANNLLREINKYSNENIYTKINSISSSSFTRFILSDRNLTGITLTANVTFYNSFDIC